MDSHADIRPSITGRPPSLIPVLRLKWSMRPVCAGRRGEREPHAQESRETLADVVASSDNSRHVLHPPSDQGEFRHLTSPFDRVRKACRLPASHPGRFLPSGVLFFRGSTMRTYDKLIATISARRSVDDVRPCSGRILPIRR